MIDISKLTESDKGRWVRMGEQTGKIKSWSTYIYVVYNCDNNWENYHNYTAEATHPAFLDFMDKGATNESP